MNTAWYIAFGVLVVAVCLLGVLVLGILRRSLETLSRVNAYLETVEAESLDASLPLVGALAPTLPTGTPLLGDFSVTFVEYQCEACRILAADLARKPLGDAVGRHVLVVDALVGEFAKVTRAGEVLTDSSRTVFDSWKVQSTPTTYYIGPSGLVMAGLHPGSGRDIGQLRKKAVASLEAADAMHPHDHDHEHDHGHDHDHAMSSSTVKGR